MKGIRISMPLVRTSGTCLVPQGYKAKTYKWLQSKVDVGTWMIGIKYNDMLEKDKYHAFDVLFNLLDAMTIVGWVSGVVWYSNELVIFRDETGNAIAPLQNACAQVGFYCYKPYATWKENAPAQL